MRCNKNNIKKEVHSNIDPAQETWKVSNTQSNLTHKKIRKNAKKDKISKRKEIIMMRVDISKVETKRTIEKSNETKIKKIDEQNWQTKLDSEKKSAGSNK